MRATFAAITATLAVFSLAAISDAQAGSSQSAPSKYRQDTNRNARAVVSTRPVAIGEFSSSSARASRNAPQR